MLPRLLQIFQERLRPGAEPAYSAIEESLAELCRRKRCPNRYLALASLDRPIEVWWLNRYDSQAGADRVAQAYAENPELTSAMMALSAGKQDLIETPVDVMATLRPDLSGMQEWLAGALRFAVVLETPAPEPSTGAVFQAPDGRAFAFHAVNFREEADRLAKSLGGRIFEVRPSWSFPEDDWIARNPALWKRSKPA